jgi:NAD(P)H-hydrate epimerase
VVLDADALNSLAGQQWRARCFITPHPGEMSRLAGITVGEVQKDRLAAAMTYAAAHGCCVVLKGHRTVIAFPDGRAWINPTGTPGMATGGTGDILTGLIAGLIAQAPDEPDIALLAAVYLHGLAGQFGVRELGEQCLLATDLLTYLPEAIRACRELPDEL